jgi:agmatinase
VIDPLERWQPLGDKPDYAGLLTYGGLPYTQDAGELRGVDVAIVGAPTDDLVSDRPGTRFAPRAIRAASCPPGPHLEGRVDALRELVVVDFGDAPVIPADPERSHAAIEALVGEVLDAGALPVVLGGDHSISEADIRAVARRHGPVGLVHFDTHTDTGTEVFGVERSHGTPMYRLVHDGHVDAQRYVQIGLRGYWPGEAEFAWQAEQGITSYFMHDVRRLGIDAVIAATVAAVGPGPVFVTVDVDVLDPAFAPGTGTPEPGGLTSLEPARSGARGRRAARGRRRGPGRDHPDRRRLDRRDCPRRGPDRPRAPHRSRRSAPGLPGASARRAGVAFAPPPARPRGSRP